MGEALIVEEEWRPVVGWEGLYEVSSRGRVRSLDRMIKVAASAEGRRFKGAYTRVQRGRLLAQSLCARQRLVHLSGKGRLVQVRVAILVVQSFTDWNLQGGVLSFVNGDSLCVRLDNLQMDGLSMKGEVWLPCPDFTAHYEVSSLGRVRAMPSVVEVLSRRGKLYDRRRRARILRPAAGPAGYPTVSLYDGGGMAATRQVHALVCRAFHGDHYPRLHVLHRDGDPKNSAADNLYWGTRQDNKRDEYVHGFAKLAGITVEEAYAMIDENRARAV